MTLARDDALTLHALEEAMWRAETRFDRAFMDTVLAPGFREIGQSGRVWTREEILALEPLPIDVRLPLVEFEARGLAPDVAQVTYRSVPAHGEHGEAIRSSIWVRTDRWRLEFHQATPSVGAGSWV